MVEYGIYETVMRRDLVDMSVSISLAEALDA